MRLENTNITSLLTGRGCLSEAGTDWGPAKFYEKAVGAMLIEGSNQGIYRGLLSEVQVE